MKVLPAAFSRFRGIHLWKGFIGLTPEFVNSTEVNITKCYGERERACANWKQYMKLLLVISTTTTKAPSQIWTLKYIHFNDSKQSFQMVSKIHFSLSLSLSQTHTRTHVHTYTHTGTHTHTRLKMSFCWTSQIKYVCLSGYCSLSDT